MVSELQTYLQANIHNLRGAWVQKKSAYEADICHALLMQKEAADIGMRDGMDTFLNLRKAQAFGSTWFDIAKCCFG